jgi:hypothetical protein
VTQVRDHAVEVGGSIHTFHFNSGPIVGPGSFWVNVALRCGTDDIDPIGGSVPSVWNSMDAGGAEEVEGIAPCIHEGSYGQDAAAGPGVILRTALGLARMGGVATATAGGTVGTRLLDETAVAGCISCAWVAAAKAGSDVVLGCAMELWKSQVAIVDVVGVIYGSDGPEMSRVCKREYEGTRGLVGNTDLGNGADALLDPLRTILVSLVGHVQSLKICEALRLERRYQRDSTGNDTHSS